MVSNDSSSSGEEEKLGGLRARGAVGGAAQRKTSLDNTSKTSSEQGQDMGLGSTSQRLDGFFKGTTSLQRRSSMMLAQTGVGSSRTTAFLRTAGGRFPRRMQSMPVQSVGGIGDEYQIGDCRPGGSKESRVSSGSSRSSEGSVKDHTPGVSTLRKASNPRKGNAVTDGRSPDGVRFDYAVGSSIAIDSNLPVDAEDTRDSEGREGHDVEEDEDFEDEPRVLGFWTITLMVFFSACDGPWGSEPLFNYGPLAGFCAIFFVTVFWSWPQCELTAELGCLFPVNGGVSIWINEAFGTFWSSQASYYSWVSSLVCSANMVVLLVDGGMTYFPDSIGQWSETSLTILKVCVVWLCVLPNLISADKVSMFVERFGTMQFLPLVLFLFYVFGKTAVYDVEFGTSGLTSPTNDMQIIVSTRDLSVETNSSFEPKGPMEILMRADWDRIGFKEGALLLRLAYWAMTGWDNVAAVAGEIDNPHLSLPPALRTALLMSVFQYTMVLSAIALVDTQNMGTWRDQDLLRIAREALIPDAMIPESSNDTSGSLSNITTMISNAPSFVWYILVTTLAMAINFAGNLGLYLTELFCCSHQLAGLTDAGVLPRWTRLNWRHPKYGTLWIGLLVHTTLASCLVTLKFEELLVFDNCFNSLPDLLGIICFVYLRKTRPNAPRRYRMPDWMYKFWMPGHVCIILCVLFLSIVESQRTFFACACAICFGFVCGRINVYNDVAEVFEK